MTIGFVLFYSFLDGWNLGEFLITKGKSLVSDSLVSTVFNDTLSDELGIVNLRACFLDFANLLIHVWLSEFRLVKLVVSITTITNNVNENILVESLSVFDCEFAHSVDGFWIISVDMNDWGIECLSDITAVERSSSVNRISSETNLIIYNHMDGTSNREFWNFSKCKRFIHNTLCGECCITVKLNIQYFLVCFSIKLSTCFAHTNWVD